MKYAIALLGLALILLGAFSVALADNNLCHTVWAGQCTTLRQWQAGHCYANEAASVCDTMYGDVVNGSSAESTGTSSQSGGQTEGAVAQSAGAEQTQTFQGRSLKSAEELQQQAQQQQQQQQQQQGQQQNQNQNCTPSISYSGVSGSTYSFSVSKCGKPLSAMGDWTLAAKIASATSSDGLCSAGVYHLADAYGNHIGNQLYWAKYDNCYENNKSVTVS